MLPIFDIWMLVGCCREDYSTLGEIRMLRVDKDRIKTGNDEKCPVKQVITGGCYEEY